MWERSRWKLVLVVLIWFGSYSLKSVYIHASNAHSVEPPGLMFPNDPLESFHFGRKLLNINLIRQGQPRNCTPRAIENFPKDLFTEYQLSHGAVVLHIFFAVYMFIAVAIVCDEYFIPCLKRICERATFMAAGSSAPELATTLVGVFIAKDDIGLGAVVGSADFNIMLVISVSALFAKQVIYLNWWPLVRDCLFYLFSITLLAFTILDERVYWYEALIFLVIYGLYVLVMYFNPRLDAFWEAWCAQRPDGCCRIVRTEAEEREIEQQQHSGGFSHSVTGSTAEPNLKSLEDGTTNSPSQVAYKQLAMENDANRSNTTYAPFNHADNDRGDSPVHDGDRDPLPVQSSDHTFSSHSDDAYFSSLLLPDHVGLKGKLYYAYRVVIWPIHCMLCLTTPDIRKPVWSKRWFSQWISFTMCCVWIGAFTTTMIWMITTIGYTFNIPDTVMGLTFIAAGSSVPDAIASVLVVREGEGDMAVSNAIASNVFDILICMGLPWLLKCATSSKPVMIYSKGLLYSTLTLFTTIIFLLVVTHLNRWRLTKSYGIVLLVGYVVVLVFCSCYELNVFGLVHDPPCSLPNP